MKVYQRGGKDVKGAVKVIDCEKVIECATEGLMGLALELGLEVVRQMLEEDATALAGRKGKHNAERVAYRHGSERTKLVLGGEKVSAERPRVRSKEGVELALPTLKLFQGEDPLNGAILRRLLSGVSTRKYAGTLETVEREVGCGSKSEVSRRFIGEMKKRAEEFFKRRIEGSYPVIELDGVEIDKMTVLAALGIDREGKKQILGIVEGGSENSEVAKALLNDLIERGLNTEEPRLYILDGGKALRKAVKEVFGERAVIQRCQVHKKRNVLAHLPQSEQANVSVALTKAYQEFDYEKAKSALLRLAADLEHKYPKAADSLREGLEETLTAHRLNVPGLLRQTLSNTNALESANSVCRSSIRRVSNFRNGEMTLRHAAAGFMQAERGFRRVKGYRQIPLLVYELNRLLNLVNHGIIDVA